MPESPGNHRRRPPSDRQAPGERRKANVDWSFFILSAPARTGSATSNPSGRENHPIDSISWKACGTESGTVRIMPRRLSFFWIGVCPMTRRGGGGFGSIHQFVPDGVMGYFRVVLHPRLQQETLPIAAACSPPP